MKIDLLLHGFVATCCYMKTFMLRVRLSHGQRHRLMEKCQNTKKTMTEFAIDSMGLEEPVEIGKDPFISKVVESQEEQIDPIVLNPNHDKIVTVRPRKCMEPGCTIEVPEPVTVHGMKAFLCQLHS